MTCSARSPRGQHGRETLVPSDPRCCTNIPRGTVMTLLRKTFWQVRESLSPAHTGPTGSQSGRGPAGGSGLFWGPRWRQGQPDARGPRCACCLHRASARPAKSQHSERGLSPWKPTKGHLSSELTPLRTESAVRNPDPKAQGPVGTWHWWEAGPQRPYSQHRTACVGLVVQVPAQSWAGEEPCVSGGPFPQAVLPHGGAAHAASAPGAHPLGSQLLSPAPACSLAPGEEPPRPSVGAQSRPEPRAGPGAGGAGGPLSASRMAALHPGQRAT